MDEKPVVRRDGHAVAATAYTYAGAGEAIERARRTGQRVWVVPDLSKLGKKTEWDHQDEEEKS